MTDTVTLIKQRLMSIFSRGLNAKSVKTMSVQSISEFPSVVIFTGPATHDLEGSDLSKTVRDFRVLILVQSMRLGGELEAEKACEPFYDITAKLLWEAPSLNDPDTGAPLERILDVLVTNDSGFIVTELEKKMYASMELVCQVTYYLPIERQI